MAYQVQTIDIQKTAADIEVLLNKANKTIVSVVVDETGKRIIVIYSV
jgi:hypothetical protein